MHSTQTEADRVVLGKVMSGEGASGQRPPRLPYPQDSNPIDQAASAALALAPGTAPLSPRERAPPTPLLAAASASGNLEGWRNRLKVPSACSLATPRACINPKHPRGSDSRPLRHPATRLSQGECSFASDQQTFRQP